jgi:hypothetical protein
MSYTSGSRTIGKHSPLPPSLHDHSAHSLCASNGGRLGPIPGSGRLRPGESLRPGTSSPRRVPRRHSRTHLRVGGLRGWGPSRSRRWASIDGQLGTPYPAVAQVAGKEEDLGGATSPRLETGPPSPPIQTRGDGAVAAAADSVDRENGYCTHSTSLTLGNVTNWCGGRHGLGRRRKGRGVMVDDDWSIL